MDALTIYHSCGVGCRRRWFCLLGAGVSTGNRMGSKTNQIVKVIVTAPDMDCHEREVVSCSNADTTSVMLLRAKSRKHFVLFMMHSSVLLFSPPLVSTETVFVGLSDGMVPYRIRRCSEMRGWLSSQLRHCCVVAVSMSRGGPDKITRCLKRM